VNTVIKSPPAVPAHARNPMSAISLHITGDFACFTRPKIKIRGFLV
jgi:hypothetical protein